MEFQVKLPEEKQKFADAIVKRPTLYDPRKRYDLKERSRLWEEVAMEIVWKSANEGQRSDVVEYIKKKWSSMRSAHNKSINNPTNVNISDIIPFLCETTISSTLNTLLPDASEQSSSALFPSPSYDNNLPVLLQHLEKIVNDLKNVTDVLKRNLPDPTE